MANFGIRLAAAAALVGAAVAGAPTHAAAANVTDNFSFNIGPFTGQPVVPGNWIGTFSVTFDPTTSTVAEVAVNAFSSNVPALVTPWDYVVSTTFVTGHTVLVVGNDCASNSCIDQIGGQSSPQFVANTGFIQLDLGATASVLTTAPVVLAAEYAGGTGVSMANPHWSASVNVLSPANAVTVPEPTSIALMFTGLAALAGLRFRRAKASV